MKKYVYLFVALIALMSCQPKAEEQLQKVFGRYVPERKDDFAWENEYAAFRMYGPALRPENPSNGVDLWLKASPELVVDSFYYREHVLGLPYHINYGKGLDCYKVGHTAGCGGLVVMADEDFNDQIYVGGPYDQWTIIEQTADKLVFRLTYDSFLVAGHVLQESITVTAEAGKIFNKAEVVLSGDYKGGLWIGGGIFLHDSIDKTYLCEEQRGLVAYAEEALSDKTAAQMNFDYNGSTSQGRNYVAVYTPEAKLQGVVGGNLVSLRPYLAGDTITYYFGACWSEWRNGELSFPTDESWFEAVQQETGTLL